MTYRLTRNGGEEDENTSQSFYNFDDAYNFLKRGYREICCSNADYEDRPYYEIINSKQKSHLPQMSVNHLLKLSKVL